MSYGHAAASAIASEFRAFCREGEDEEVSAVFESLAQQAESDAAYLKPSGSTVTNAAVAISSRLPTLVQVTHRSEEQLVQRLIMGYAACGGMRALCSSIAYHASAAGESDTSKTAARSEQLYDVLAGRIWSFISTRSLIAFNVLTATEIDPAIETKSRL